MELHRLCKLLPEMPKSEFTELVEDIAKYGQLQPIVTYEGQVLDGRHRYNACCILGKAPWFEEWDGQCESPARFVVSMNLRRRDLEKSQRAALALQFKDEFNAEYEEKRLANLKWGGKNPHARVVNIDNSGANARKEAAAAFGVSDGYVYEAEKIREAAPDVFEEVLAGELSIPQAKRKIAEKAKPVSDTMPLLSKSDLDDADYERVEYINRSLEALKKIRKNGATIDGVESFLSWVDGAIAEADNL